MKNETTYSLLNALDNPEDLRRLTPEQLPEVCHELRQDIIKEVSCNPGHFAASLGVVELTVALHYVFNTPYDRLVWDVGHQAYGHKILTGRRDTFSTNRKMGGIRPFPSAPVPFSVSGGTLFLSFSPLPFSSSRIRFPALPVPRFPARVFSSFLRKKENVAFSPQISYICKL